MVADGYKDTKIGFIPVEWDVVEIGSLGKTYSGLSGKTKEDFGSGSPYITYMNVFSNNSIDATMVEYVNINSNETQNIVQNGDIFFTVSSETKDEVGMTSVLLEELEENTYINSFCFGFRLHNNEKLRPRFAQFLLREHNTRKRITFYGAGTTRINISKVKLMNLLLPLPPLKEQEKIADILSTADEKIDAIASQIQKAETLKKGLQKKLFIEGIEHTEFKDTGLSIVYPMRRIPEAWELKKLSDITTKITDGAHFTPTYVEKGIPFLRVTDLKSKNLLASAIKYIPEDEHIELIKRCKPEYGDILYSKNGTIGLTRIITWDWEFSIFVSLCLIKPKRSLIIPEYLKYYLTSDIVNTQIKIRAKQGTVTNLHLEEIRDFFITIPPIEEQQQISNILLAADKKVEVLKAKKEKYETLKKGLLQKLLSGEIRV